MRPMVHGKDSSYRAHLRRDETPCAACRAAHNVATRTWRDANPLPPQIPRPRIGRPLGSARRDEVMGEWEHLRGSVTFREFPPKVGMTYTAWERMFFRARAAGDRRAVRRVERWAA